MSMNDHMSFSQLCRFETCEAEAMAELRGEWTPKSGKALIVGKYFHAALESAAAFAEVNQANAAEIFNRKGEKYADFLRADEMIGKIMSDDKCAWLIEGGKPEIEVEGEFAGSKWVCRIDNLVEEHNIFIDYKTVADIRAGEWVTIKDPVTGERKRRCVSFIEARHYDWQMAIYEEIIRQKLGIVLMPMIVAVSKQSPCDLEVIAFDDPADLKHALEEIEERMPRILELKSGKAEPKRCGVCDYCRATAKIGKIKSYTQFKQEVF